MKSTLLMLALTICSPTIQAEKPTKQGYNLGGLPAVSYNSDLGLQYGLILNLFDYGNGSRYPSYDHSAYLEISRYTKGSGIYRFYYDSERLIPGVRSFAELSYLTDDLMDFYGFNGYKSIYSTDRPLSERTFYKMAQKQVRLLTDFKGKTPIQHLYWLASLNLENYRIKDVDSARLNKGLSSADPTFIQGDRLYNSYQRLGLIDAKEAKGGTLTTLKAGLLYDTRTVLNNPDKGFYTEALIELAPDLINNLPYSRYSLIHCQYQSLIKDRLTAAIRLGAQGQLGAQHVPFFRRTQLMSPFAKRTNVTGFGGSNSLRGIVRNRIVGDAVGMANIELRWKVVNFQLFNQNFYFGLNGFFDTGIILDPIDWDENMLKSVNSLTYIDVYAKDGLHSSLGGGIKVAMNENFILSTEMGHALNKQDGDKPGMYINLNYLF